MCFSPEADLFAGVVIGAIALDVVRQHPVRRDLPLSFLPPLLAVHSLIEAAVWLAGRGQMHEWVGTTATYAYLAIAFVVLPTFVPVAVLAREPSRVRRRLLWCLVGVGACVSAILLWSIVNGPVGAPLHPHYIAYDVDILGAGAVVPLYVLATCGAGLASSSRPIASFAVLNLVAVALLAWLTASGLTSLWCGWAAVTSVAIAFLVRRDEERT